MTCSVGGRLASPAARDQDHGELTKRQGQESRKWVPNLQDKRDLPRLIGAGAAGDEDDSSGGR
jgi:hypothetical protein